MKRIVVPEDIKVETDTKRKTDFEMRISPEKKQRLDELTKKFKYSVVEILKEWIKK
jgi:predicted DNA-binding protein